MPGGLKYVLKTDTFSNHNTWNLNTEIFLAKRILSGRNSLSATAPIVRIAIAGIALGFCMMIITLAVLSGFKQEIREKVTGFGAHIQISNLDQNSSYETKPVPMAPAFLGALKKMPDIRHVQPFATKAGIITVSYTHLTLPTILRV